MIKNRPKSLFLFSKSRRATTSTLHNEPPPPSPCSVASDVSFDRLSLCFFEIEQLIRRGMVSSAQQVVHRSVARSSSASDVLSVSDYAFSRGLKLNLTSYEVIIRKLVELKHPEVAKSVFDDRIVNRGIEPNESILNSMVICLCKLGEYEKATLHFERLIDMDCAPSKIACNYILRDLFRRRRFLDAYDYFIKISDAGVDLGLWTYNTLADGLCGVGYLEEAITVLKISYARTGLRPTLHLYKSLFYGLCKRGWTVEAVDLFGEMESMGFFIDKTMYTCLIHALSRIKNMTMAMRVYLRMLKTGCQPDAYTCKTFIYGFANKGLIKQAFVWFNRMILWGMQPDVVAYQILVNEYCRKGMIDDAAGLFNTMIKCNIAPNVHCYTALIASHQKNNSLVADDLYSSMLGRGVVPDHVLFFVRMRNMKKGQEHLLAWVTLQEIAEIGCGLNLSSIPNLSKINPSADSVEKSGPLLEELAKKNLSLATQAFSIVISALSAAGKKYAALHYMEKMESLGCRPFVSTYNSLIKLFCQEGCFEDVHSKIDLMQDRGVIPDEATYLIVVKGYCNQGDFRSAYDILEHMEEDGMKPAVAIYDVIIDSLGKKGKLVAAKNMFERMLKSDVDPDEVLYVTMINAYSRNGRATEAEQLFEQMIERPIQPSCSSYTALISGLVNQNTTKGCEYLDRMLGDGLEPNTVFYTSLIKNFLRKGEVQFACRLFDLMQDNQIERDFATFSVLVSGVCQNITGRKEWWGLRKENIMARERLFHLLQRKHELIVNSGKNFPPFPKDLKSFALDLIQKVKEICVEPNIYLYNSIIFGYCKADMMPDAYEQLDLMERNGIPPNLVTYTILMKGHIQAGQVNTAVKQFNTLNKNGFSSDIMYNALLEGLCEVSRSLEALSVVYTMQKKGFYPTRNSYEKLLQCFCAARLSDPAFKICEEMLALGIFPRTQLLDFFFKTNTQPEASMFMDKLKKITLKAVVRKRKETQILLINSR